MRAGVNLGQDLLLVEDSLDTRTTDCPWFCCFLHHCSSSPTTPTSNIGAGNRRGCRRGGATPSTTTKNPQQVPRAWIRCWVVSPQLVLSTFHVLSLGCYYLRALLHCCCCWRTPYHVSTSVYRRWWLLLLLLNKKGPILPQNQIGQENRRRLLEERHGLHEGEWLGEDCESGVCQGLLLLLLLNVLK